MSQETVDLYNQASSAVQAGQLADAISFTEQALTEDPSDRESWELYTKLLGAAGRTADAAKALEKLKSMGLGEVEILSIEATEAISQGDIAKGIAIYLNALELEPENSEIHASLAVAHLQNNDHQSAIASAEQALTIDPENPQANYTIGHVLRLQGKSKEALTALTKAVDAEPDLTIALYEQGMILAENGRLEEALENFKKIASITPNDDNVKTAISNISRQLQETKTY